MSSPKAPTLEEFRARAALSGLNLMQRIPTHWAWAAEPPHVFRADE